MSERIYTLYGMLAEQYDAAQTFHAKTQQLLRDIATGKVEPAQLRVTEDGWSVAPPEPKAAEDA